MKAYRPKHVWIALPYIFAELNALYLHLRLKFYLWNILFVYYKQGECMFALSTHTDKNLVGDNQVGRIWLFTAQLCVHTRWPLYHFIILNALPAGELNSITRLCGCVVCVYIFLCGYMCAPSTLYMLARTHKYVCTHLPLNNVTRIFFRLPSLLHNYFILLRLRNISKEYILKIVFLPHCFVVYLALGFTSSSGRLIK